MLEGRSGGGRWDSPFHVYGKGRADPAKRDKRKQRSHLERGGVASGEEKGVHP